MTNKELLDMPEGIHGMNVKLNGAGIVSGSTITTEGTGSVSIGASKLEGCVIYAEPGSKVIIGDECYLRGTHIIARNGSIVVIEDRCDVHGEYWGKTVFHAKGGKITIDKDCLFSGNIIVRNADGHKINGEEIVDNIYIGEHVWVCENARILKGSRIARGSIVACGTVVTKSSDSEVGSILAGSPAEVVKYISSWEK